MRVLLRGIVISLSLISLELFAVQGTFPPSGDPLSQAMGGQVAIMASEFSAAVDNPALLSMTKTKVGAQKFFLGFEYISGPNSFRLTPISTEFAKDKMRGAAQIPYLGYFYNISDRFKFSTELSMIGAGGDYSGTPYRQKATFFAGSLPLALSYKASESVSLGLSLAPQFTQIENNNFDTKTTKKSSTSFVPAIGATVNLPQDLVLAAYLNFGATDTLKEALYSSTTKKYYDSKIGTPLLFSIGLARNTEDYSLGFRYRLLNWKNAETFKQLGWQNVHQFSVGGDYKPVNFLKLRGGVAYSTNIYKETSNINGDETIDLNGLTINKFARDWTNGVQYGTEQLGINAGFGYLFSKSEIAFAAVYLPEATQTFKGRSTATGDYEVTRKQHSIVVNLSYLHEI